MDLTGVKGAADEITTETVPKLIAALDALMDRIEKLAERLDGAKLVTTVTLGSKR